MNRPTHHACYECRSTVSDLMTSWESVAGQWEPLCPECAEDPDEGDWDPVDEREMN